MEKLAGIETDLGIAAAESVSILLLGWLISFLVGRLVLLIAGKKGEEPGKIAQRVRKVVARGLALVSVLAAVAIAGLNAYLLYKKQPLLETQLNYLSQISPEARKKLLLGLLQVLGAAWLTSLSIRWMEKGVQYAATWAKGWNRFKGNDESIDRLAVSLRNIIGRVGWLFFSWFTAKTLGLPAPAVSFLLISIKVYAIIAVGLLLWRSLDVIIVTAQDLSQRLDRSHGWLVYYNKLEFLIPTARRSLEYIIYVSAASLAISQVEFIAGVAIWGPRVVRVIGYFFLARVGVALTTLLTDEWATAKANNTREQNQRLLTLVPLFKSLQQYAIYFFVAVAILGALGVDAGPILAGAGIAGLAVGFGAQSVIKDVVTGFFILFENYFVVGDFVKIGDVRGTVMGVDLRTTRLRDLEGGLHIIPNGDVTHVVHYSKEYVNALVDVGVAYDSDLDQVREVLQEVGRKLLEDDDRVLAETEVLGVQGLGESDVVLRTLTRVKPGVHYEVARAYREAVKKRFDELGIEIPFARRVLIFQDAQGNEVEPPKLGGKS